jgi:hypothetical protein
MFVILFAFVAVILGDRYLPDPFLFNNGSRIKSASEWEQRRQEIIKDFYTAELGDKPDKPSTVTASFSGSTLSITCSNGGSSISFTASITKPSGNGPFPAIIGYGGGSLPIPSGVATINFNNDDIAAQQDKGSRGSGKFYTLYGSSHSAGALIAWAWGVSRIIDALEITSSAGIDTKRIGVTGCSRNGKGAFVAGAFDERIALTLPQESGSGGAACWRISDDEDSKGKNIQTAHEIIGENCWFSSRFDTYASNTGNLPIDHHELAALVYPRGLFVIENDIDWLGPVSTTACQEIGQLIYNALGSNDGMGFSLVGNHNHCSFPSSQQNDLTAFINKYLLGGSSSTSNIKVGPSVTLTDYYKWSLTI